MDFLQPQQDVLFSLYTRQQFLILQSGLGSRRLSLWFSVIHIFICNCYWAVSQHWKVTHKNCSIVCFAVLELLPVALSLLIHSLMSPTTTMLQEAFMFSILQWLIFHHHPHQWRLFHLWDGWKRNWIDYGCMQFRDGLRYSYLLDSLLVQVLIYVFWMSSFEINSNFYMYLVWITNLLLCIYLSLNRSYVWKLYDRLFL
jgi:small-conductance mechanosensitive channel